MTAVSVVGVVGGSGIDVTDLLGQGEERTVPTPYGDVAVRLGRLGGRDVGFLRRHGPGHRVPPHRINYRANIAAFAALRAERVLATAAVGALDPALAPGAFVAVDQFLDFTRGRPSTYFDGGEAGVVHADVTVPYCPEIRASLSRAAASCGLSLRDRATYVCTEGPRFETPAEIRAYRILGGDVVGMTGVPEVVLARELGLCYATLATVTNVAAGLRPQPLTHEEVMAAQADNAPRIRDVLAAAIATLPQTRGCPCPPPPGAVQG